MHADIHSGHACSIASSTRNPTFRAAETINHGLDYMQETHEHDVSPIVLHLEQMQKRYVAALSSRLITHAMMKTSYRHP